MLMSCTPLENSTATRIHSGIDAVVSLVGLAGLVAATGLALRAKRRL
jgi:hypothetical protein